jgi:hypothetical protein
MPNASPGKFWNWKVWIGVAAAVVLVAAGWIVLAPSRLAMETRAVTPEISFRLDRSAPTAGSTDLSSIAPPPATGAPEITAKGAVPAARPESDPSPGSTQSPSVKAEASAEVRRFREYAKHNRPYHGSGSIASIRPPSAAPEPDPPSPSAAAAAPVPPAAAAAAPSTPAAAEEAACRAKERSLGISNPGPCIDVGAMVDNLRRGQYHFNKPTSAYLGEPFRLTLVLLTAPDQEVSDRFDGTPGEVVKREGKFAQSLEATLRADDFTVDPPGAQARTATLSAPVEWSWLLTPHSEGQKRLVIEVAANLHVGADKHLVQVTTLREAVVIQVGVLQRIKLYVAELNSWAVALSGLVAALGSLLAFVPPARRFVVGLFRRHDPAAGSTQSPP